MKTASELATTDLRFIAYSAALHLNDKTAGSTILNYEMIIALISVILFMASSASCCWEDACVDFFRRSN